MNRLEHAVANDVADGAASSTVAEPWAIKEMADTSVVKWSGNDQFSELCPLYMTTSYGFKIKSSETSVFHV